MSNVTTVQAPVLTTAEMEALYEVLQNQYGEGDRSAIVAKMLDILELAIPRSRKQKISTAIILGSGAVASGALAAAGASLALSATPITCSIPLAMTGNVILTGTEEENAKLGLKIGKVLNYINPMKLFKKKEKKSESI